MKLGFLESKNRMPRQTPKPLCPLVKVGLLGPKQMAGTEPLIHLTQGLLMKLNLQVVRGTAPRQNPHWQCRLVMLDLLGPGEVARPAQPKEQQMQSLLLKLGLVGLRSSACTSERGRGSTRAGRHA